MSDLPEFVFCIAHGEMVKLEESVGDNCTGHYYTSRVSLYGVSFEDGEFCCLEDGYAFTPPPDSLFSDMLDYMKTDEWKNWCEENQPDYDEQLAMDLQAISLLEELRNL